MRKILAYGVYLDKNFGGPSIVHGLIQTLRNCDEDSEIIFYHARNVSEKEKSCYPIPIKTMPFGTKRLLVAFVISWAAPSPGAEMFGCGKGSHIAADF